MLLLVAAGCLIKPGWITDLVGFVALGIVFLLQRSRNQKEKNLALEALSTGKS
jgi:UPF0716 family protein affecting phage T7 exclusion